MPLLPSGRHAGVDSAPFIELLKGCASPFNTHKIMAIKEWADMLPWLELLLYCHEAEATEAQKKLAKEQGPMDGPPGLVPIHTGCRVSDWEQFTADWPAEDRLAMRGFIYGRAREVFQPYLDRVKKIREVLLASHNTLPGAFAHMWELGIHPLQKDDEDEA